MTSWVPPSSRDWMIPIIIMWLLWKVLRCEIIEEITWRKIWVRVTPSNNVSLKDSIGEAERGLLRNGWPQGATPHHFLLVKPSCFLEGFICWAFKCRNMDSAVYKANLAVSIVSLTRKLSNWFNDCAPFSLDCTLLLLTVPSCVVSV